MDLATLLGLPEAGGWALFALATLALNATPGVDLLLVGSRTLQHGARAGLAAAAGVCVGCLGHTAAVAVGLAAVLAASPAAFRVLEVAGAVYLAWLAIGLLRQAMRAPADSAAGARAEPPAPVAAGVSAAFRAGVLTNLLNPKVALFFLAFLPQFVSATAPAAAGGLAVMGLAFVGQSFVFLVVLVAVIAGLAQRVRQGLASRPSARSGGLAGRVAAGVGGLLFLAMALRLAGDVWPSSLSGASR
jgi:threonine/homoserine/homoserine lactone efflux protein